MVAENAKPEGPIKQAIHRISEWYSPAKPQIQPVDPELEAQRDQAIAAGERMKLFVGSDAQIELTKYFYAEYQALYQQLSVAKPEDAINIARIQAGIAKMKFALELPQKLVEDGQKAQEDRDADRDAREKAAGLKKLEDNGYAAI